jgi:transcriptional regulator NrdR family protein
MPKQKRWRTDESVREIVCPIGECGARGTLYVVDTRYSPPDEAIRRRRKCRACGGTLTTFEPIAVRQP